MMEEISLKEALCALISSLDQHNDIDKLKDEIKNLAKISNDGIK